MSRWKFVHVAAGMINKVEVEADTWEEALAKIGQGKTIISTLGDAPLPPGLWEVSEEPEETPE